MSQQENHEKIYIRIKKRLMDYKYHSFFYGLMTMVFAVFFTFSLIPFVPVIIAAILNIPPSSSWIIVLWFLCVVIFGVLFWIFQRLSRRIEEKYGITLEEKMYVLAYQALCYLKESLDPDHPIIGSKSKAERQVQRILTLLGQITIPKVTILKEESVQLLHMWNNLRNRLIPLMRRNPENAVSLLDALLDYLSRPELPRLVMLNRTMESIPEIVERNIYLDVKNALIKRSNLRHITMFALFTLVAFVIYNVHQIYFNASADSAFQLCLMLWIGLVGIYVSYLGLTKRK
jgi:hypothetical protein